MQPTKPTLAEIQARRAAIEAEDRAAEEQLDAAAQARAAEQRERAELRNVMLAELGTDLGASPQNVNVALSALSPQEARDRLHAPIWFPLLWLTRERPDFAAAIESRHVLAAVKALPQVRAGDRAFGGSVAKRVREMPASRSKTPRIIDHTWWEPMFRAAGVVHDLYPPDQADGESEAAARARVFALRDRGAYDRRNAANNHELAMLELELLDKERLARLAELRGKHEGKGRELRARFLATIDAELARMPLGVGWWWLRQLRALAADERPTVTDGDRVWKSCVSLSALPDFSKAKG